MSAEHEGEQSWGSDREVLNAPILALILESGRDQQRLGERENGPVIVSLCIIPLSFHSSLAKWALLLLDSLNRLSFEAQRG